MEENEAQKASTPPSTIGKKWSLKKIFSHEKKEDVSVEQEIPADGEVKTSEGIQKKPSISSFFSRSSSKKGASSSKTSLTDLPAVKEPENVDNSVPSKQMSKVSVDGEVLSPDHAPKEPGRTSTLGRVISNATTPLFAWLKAPAAQHDTGGTGHVVNPMLHMATFAMHLHDEEAPNKAGNASIPDGDRLLRSDFWDGGDESSVESFEDEEEREASKAKFSVAQGSSSDNSYLTVPGAPKKELSIDEKIQLVFELPEVEKYEKELACWLVRSVLLKGYMYLTENHVCFYSSLPNVPGPVRKEGFLQKRSFKRPRNVFYTYWFVLKTDGLYIYSDAKELYYPKSTIYLKNVLSVTENAETQAITLVTTVKEYIFKADTLQQMHEWVEAINAAVFNSKISGNDVRVVLPYDCISDISIVKDSFNNDSLRILVVVDESFQPEEYLFSYFNDVHGAYELLKSLWDKTRTSTTVQTDASGKRLLHRKPMDTSSASLSPIDKAPSTSGSGKESTGTKPPRLSWVPVQKTPVEIQLKNGTGNTADGELKGHRKSLSSSSPASVSVPDFREFSPGGSVVARNSNSEDGNRPAQRVDSEKKKSWWSHRKTSSDGGEPFVAEDGAVTEAKNELFKSHFAIPQTERLLQTFSAYINKVLPLLGKIYVSANYICFKSVRVGFRVKAVVALADINHIELRKSYSPFVHTMVIFAKDTNDEIIFDFHTSDTRQKCYNLLQHLMSAFSGSKRRPTSHVAVSRPNSGLLDDIVHVEQHVAGPNAGESKPQPPRKMHITCITIGTRGDVQPYIALIKGLMKDGHTCRLATHEEYREWIEGFGIEFKPVKGDPAELMQLCVDYGMFTVGFIREALKKFRGWLEELLVSCYEAAQGTDLLIESPTAFAGIHVAEAMGIPYFSAFPFPWTRTRTYPHPFGVAERHMGGSYNYMTYVMIEQVLWKALIISVNPWRKSIGLPPAPFQVEEHKTPFLYSFSPSVVPAPPDWQDWIHECGYWFLDNPDLSWTPPPGLAEFIAKGPCIYIGFGSIIVQNPDEMTKIIVEAVKKSGVRAILSKGWSGRSKEGPETVIEYPDSIYPLKSVPHDWLFPQLVGVVHHGGAGTTAAGLRAGCATIIHPFFGDQFFWADRVVDLGVGLCVRKLAVDSLSIALAQFSTDKIMREKARALGEKIKSENGVENAIGYIYRDLEYAETRIKHIAEMNRKRANLI